MRVGQAQDLYTCRHLKFPLNISLHLQQMHVWWSLPVFSFSSIHECISSTCTWWSLPFFQFLLNTHECISSTYTWWSLPVL